MRIWRIPEGGFAETVEQPWRELKGACMVLMVCMHSAALHTVIWASCTGHHMKCNIVRFHPLSAHVLVSACM